MKPPALGRLGQPKLALGLAAGWLLALVLVAALLPWLSLPHPPSTPDLANATVPPGQHPTHYLGTDPIGRDVLTEVLFGTRQVLLLSLPAAALAVGGAALLGAAAGFWGNRGLRLPWTVALGLLLGLGAWLQPPLLAGGAAVAALLIAAYYYKGRLPLPLDSLVLGGATLLSTLPRLVLVLVFLSGPPLGDIGLLVLLALLAWPDMARIVRTQGRQLRVQPYVEAARATGLPEGRVWWRHVLPAACRPLLMYAPLTLSGLIGLESTLAFLGIGISPTTPSWGNLLSQFRLAPEAWWLLVFPGGILLGTMVALQVLARHWTEKK